MKKKTKTAAPEPNYLQQWRVFKNLSGEQLAENIGTTKSVISLLESGARKLSPKWARRIAPALGIRAGWLLDYDPNTIDRDLLDTWSSVPEEMQGQAIETLKSFARKSGT